VCCWKRVVVDEMAASEGGSRRTTESEKNTEKSMKEMTKKPIKRIKVRGEEQVVTYLSVTVVSKSENLLFPSSLSALGFLIAMILFIIISDSSLHTHNKTEQLVVERGSKLQPPSE
jgi:hypothetical protein